MPGLMLPTLPSPLRSTHPSPRYSTRPYPAPAQSGTSDRSCSSSGPASCCFYAAGPCTPTAPTARSQVPAPPVRAAACSVGRRRGRHGARHGPRSAEPYQHMTTVPYGVYTNDLTQTCRATWIRPRSGAGAGHGADAGLDVRAQAEAHGQADQRAPSPKEPARDHRHRQSRQPRVKDCPEDEDENDPLLNKAQYHSLVKGPTRVAP